MNPRSSRERVISRLLCSVSPASALALLLMATPSLALGPNGAPIDTSDYTIDFYQGPILASSRSIGLAGSFEPLSEGVVGYPVNPASVAMRVPWSSDWFDWEVDGSFTSPATIQDTDFDNNGDNSFANNAALFVMLGGGLQFGEVGLGVYLNSSEHQVHSRANDQSEPTLQVEFTQANFVFGGVLIDAEVALGAGLGAHAIGLSPSSETDAEALNVEVSGATLSFGSVWLPSALPLRAGASLRVTIPEDGQAAPEGVSADENGNYLAEGYFFPRQVVPPTEFHFAIATQLFAPLNAAWHVPRSRHAAPLSFPVDEPPFGFGRTGARRVLFSTALKVTLPTRDGVGVESFFRQQIERSGTSLSVSPRFGVEGEAIPGFLVLRGGSYLEPSRFSSTHNRWHATAGLDVHVPVAWSIFGLLDDDTTFRIGGAADRAERYFGWSVSFGVWR